MNRGGTEKHCPMIKTPSPKIMTIDKYLCLHSQEDQTPRNYNFMRNTWNHSIHKRGSTILNGTYMQNGRGNTRDQYRTIEKRGLRRSLRTSQLIQRQEQQSVREPC
ncbi:hypothetical protein M758_9G164700 [Ceratodon purpureus]|nr:hypothetical protein M758_9G164700 [Ceratodon purpureus]